MKPHLLKKIILVFVAFIALGNLSTAFAAGQPEIVRKLTELFIPIHCRVQKVYGDKVYLRPFEPVTISGGELVQIIDDSGHRAAVVRLEGVAGELIEGKILSRPGKVEPEGQIVRGFDRPVRILILAGSTSGDGFNPALSELEEAARDEGALDIVVPDVAQHLLEHFGKNGPASIPKQHLRQTAEATLSDFIATVIVDESATPGKIILSLLDTSASPVLTMTSSLPTMTSPGGITVAKGKNPDNQPAARRGTGVGQRFLDRRWSGTLAREKKIRTGRNQAMGKMPWRIFKLKGAVVSAAWVYTGGVVKRDLALLYKNRLRLVTVKGNKLVTKWKSPRYGKLRLVSLAAYDTNGDGRDEIFVNAFYGSSLQSFVIDKVGETYSVVGEKMPYFFSAPSRGELLAQEGKKGSPKSWREVYTVTRTNEDLKFAHLLSLQGKEIPLGLNSTDIDGDGNDEVFGISPKGRLVIFTKSGRMVWKGGNFGVTGNVIEIYSRKSSERTIHVPPKTLVLKSPNSGLVMAVGNANRRKGGLFQRESINKGSVMFLSIEPDTYTVRGVIGHQAGWISDLIDNSRGSLGHPDRLGYIRVIVSAFSTKSIIHLPADNDR